MPPITLKRESVHSVGRIVAAAVSTGAALVSILAFARSYGLIGTPQSAHLAIGGFGATWVGVTPKADTAYSIGDTLHLAATATDSHGSALVGAAIAWTSDDRDVATVNDDGTVVARGAGTTQIVVTVGEHVARSRIFVRQQVAGVRFGGDSTLRVGEGERVKVDAFAIDARGHTVQHKAVAGWHSGDTSTVTIDSLGYATGIVSGRATVSATIEGFTEQVPMEVVAVPATIELVGGGDQRAAARCPACRCTSPRPLVRVRPTRRR